MNKKNHCISSQYSS